MKVFMSWSGDRSREVAKLLDFWIKCVVQASRPWISTSGIDSGSIWFNQINSELQDTTFGIICLTKENKEAPWILFESGALAKGLASSRVCTFLIDLETRDIRDPLAQFNHTLPNYDSMWKLVSTLNGSMPELTRLDVAILKGVFDTYWPQFKQKFDQILEIYPETTVVEPRKQEDILAEILESTRGLERRLRALESKGTTGVGIHVPLGGKIKPPKGLEIFFRYVNRRGGKDHLTINDLIELGDELTDNGLTISEATSLLVSMSGRSKDTIDEVMTHVVLGTKPEDFDNS